LVILEAVETRQLEGAFRGREEALEWVKSEYGAPEEEDERPTACPETKTPSVVLR
jgi:hypothetical protein